MSRSYKHRKSSVIHFKENNDKEHKRNAVIAVRNATDVPNGSQYKKFYCSWNICDYRWIQEKYTRDEFRKKWFDTLHSNKNKRGFDSFDFHRKKFRTWKEAYRFYLKNNKTK